MSSNGNRKRSRSRSRNKKEKHHKREDHNQNKSNQSRRKYSDEGVKLYLSNLGSNISEKKVVDEFKKFGDVHDCCIKRKNGRSNFFGYVIMKNKSSAEQAMHNINRNLGWKVTLYDKEKEENRDRKRSSSNSDDRGKSRSRSNSRKKKESESIRTGSDEEKSLNQNNTIINTVQTIDREYKSVKVREIWIGNLPNSTTYDTIYNNFFIYGEISKIELHQERNYCFIKYRLCCAASRAYEKAKNMNLGDKIIRISFSDAGKRKDIVGDEPGYELNEKSCKLIHVSMNKFCQMAPENTIKDAFKKYGNIKAFHIRNNPGFRPSIYIEYSKTEEAQAAVEDILNNDQTGEKRKVLGDPSCDVNFYFKKKPKYVFDLQKNMFQNNMAMNQNGMFQMLQSYQNKIQDPNNPLMNNQNMNNFNNFPPNFQNINFRYPANNMMPNVNNPNLRFPVPNSNPNPVMFNIFHIKGGQAPFPPNNPNMMRLPWMNQGQAQQRLPLNNLLAGRLANNLSVNNNSSNLPIPSANNVPNEQLENLITKLISQQSNKNTNVNSVGINNNNSQDKKNDTFENSTIQEVKGVFEEEYSLEEENLKNLWSGYKNFLNRFITRNKQHRVGVDVFQIRNDCVDFISSEYNLNVSHRTQFDEIFKRPIIGIIAFSPQNETQCEMFNDYIKYFSEKQRSGVVNLKTTTLYIIPPCDLSRKFYQNPKKHLLGVFVNNDAEPKIYVDMNNLQLPPPVISHTEKKLYLKQQQQAQKNSSSQNPNNNNNNNQNNSIISNNDGNNENITNDISYIISSLLKQNNFNNINNNISNDNQSLETINNILITLLGDPSLMSQLKSIETSDISSSQIMSNPQIISILSNPLFQSLLNNK